MGVFSALTDLTTGRILNILLLPAAVMAIAARLWSGGPAALLGLFLSLCIPLLLLPFWRRGLCAGDLKLLLCICCFLQPETVPVFLFAAFGLGAALAIPVFLCTRNRKTGIPFAVPVCAAVMLYLGGVY
ncbi:MAG: prepilin peptidase [Lachnospiraceae bacterium]